MITNKSLIQLGCLAHYPFRNDTKDALGLHDATSNAPYLVNQSGYENIILDGFNKVEISSALLSSTIGTFCGWISCNTVDDTYILSKCNTTSNRVFSIKYWYVSNQMRLNLQLNNSGNPNDSIYVVIKDPFIWHHIAIVADNSKWVLYVNGAPQPITTVIGNNSGKWAGAITSHDYYSIGSIQYNYNDELFSSFKAKDFMFFDKVLDRQQINAIIMDTIIY